MCIDYCHRSSDENHNLFFKLRELNKTQLVTWLMAWWTMPLWYNIAVGTTPTALGGLLHVGQPKRREASRRRRRHWRRCTSCCKLLWQRSHWDEVTTDGATASEIGAADISATVAWSDCSNVCDVNQRT